MKPKKHATKQPSEPGNSTGNKMKTEATKLPPDAGKGGKATALELAMLAAMIDPAACRNGNQEAALLRAFALLEESTFFCEEWGPMSLDERVSKLRILAFEQDSGARHLLDSIMQRFQKLPVPMLTLAMKDREDDTIRPYLQENASFEGKEKSRKSWSTVRTVMENLRCWCMFLVNTDNTRNAASIQARDIRDEEEARAKGCSVEQLNAAEWSGRQEEYWQDAKRFSDKFLSDYAVWKNGQPAGHSFPQEVVDNFIAWKKRIRTQKGGMGAVHPLTREEVFAELVKKTFRQT